MRGIAVIVAALLLVPAAAAYKNPTPGRALVLQIPGMHRAKVRKNLSYARGRRLDVYRPRTAKGRLPAVLVGGPGNRSAQKIGWAQLIAASGLAAVAADIRSARDAGSALAYVRAYAGSLGIDPARLCTLAFSAGIPSSLEETMREPKPWLRCNVAYYGPLDSALPYLERDPGGIPPMLVVEAGGDEEATNGSIGRFASVASQRHADVRVVTNPGAPRGFDLGRRTKRSKAIVRETLRYLGSRLARPLVVRDRCASGPERASALRFFTSDDTALAGVVLGGGPSGVVLAHGLNLDLCQWLPYARELAASGYRVLAYDSRSGIRVDLDMEAAVEALRRAGAVRVAAVGSSLGALAAVVGGARLRQQPEAIVSLSSPSSYGPVSALAVAPRLRTSVLFAASTEDEPFSSDARELYAAAAPAERQLQILPGAAHGVDMLERPEFRAFFEAYLAEHLR
jgi:dienelactone hydrolase